MRISDWSSDVCSSDLAGDPTLILASPTGWSKAQPAGRSALMMGGESGRDPTEEDSRLESLKERLRPAGQDDAVRTGSTEKGLDQGSSLRNRVPAESVGGISGGGLIGDRQSVE